jgi:hypothetical protein
MKSQTMSKSDRADDARREIKDLDKTIEENSLRLSALLSEAYHKAYYTRWGYTDFQQFAEKETSTGYRKAMYLIKMWDRATALKIPEDRMKDIPWTKLRNVVPLMDADNKEELLQAAETMSVRELDSKIKQTKACGKESSSVTTLKVEIMEEFASGILDAIEAAKEMLGTQNTATALYHICTDWMEQQEGEMGEAFTTDETDIRKPRLKVNGNAIHAGNGAIDEALGL